MIRIIGKVSVFVTEKQVNGKTFRAYSTSIETEQVDKTKVKDFYDVRFGSKVFPESRLASWKTNTAYVLDVTDGWLGVRSYQNGDKIGKAKYIFINDARPVTAKEFTPKAKPEPAKTEKLPF